MISNWRYKTYINNTTFVCETNIYRIQCLRNGKYFICPSKSLDRTFKQHMLDYAFDFKATNQFSHSKNGFVSKQFYSDLADFGSGAFDFYLSEVFRLECHPAFDHTTEDAQNITKDEFKRELEKRLQHLILSYNATAPGGYNTSPRI